MYEIFVILVAMILMARKPSRGRKRAMGQYIRGRVDEALSLGTLGAAVAVTGPFDETVNVSMLVSSVKATWALQLFTPTNAVGPITVGLAHSDYSSAEIEEVIENAGSWDTGDKISQERAKRLVRTVGTFRTEGAGGAAITRALEEGRVITTKLNWRLAIGDGLNVWAYNAGTVAIGTTVPVVRLQGHANLWVKG